MPVDSLALDSLLQQRRDATRRLFLCQEVTGALMAVAAGDERGQKSRKSSSIAVGLPITSRCSSYGVLPPYKRWPELEELTLDTAIAPP